MYRLLHRKSPEIGQKRKRVTRGTAADRWRVIIGTRGNKRSIGGCDY